MFGVSIALLVSHGVAFVGGAVVSIVVPKFYAWMKKVVFLSKQV